MASRQALVIEVTLGQTYLQRWGRRAQWIAFSLHAQRPGFNSQRRHWRFQEIYSLDVATRPEIYQQRSAYPVDNAKSLIVDQTNLKLSSAATTAKN